MINSNLLIKKLDTPISMYGALRTFVLYVKEGNIGHALWFSESYRDAKEEAIYFGQNLAYERLLDIACNLQAQPFGLENERAALKNLCIIKLAPNDLIK